MKIRLLFHRRRRAYENNFLDLCINILKVDVFIQLRRIASPVDGFGPGLTISSGEKGNVDYVGSAL